MKRLLSLVAVSGLLVSMAFVGTSNADVVKHETRLTIHKSPGGTVDPGDEVLVFGKLKPRKCVNDQMVKLFEILPGGKHLIGTDQLDSDGEYGINVQPDSDMDVYAKVGPTVLESSYNHTEKCKGDRSPTLTINVSG